MPVTMRILKMALQGIAELHDRDVAHILDIKPDNIMANCPIKQALSVDQVQITDLENATYLHKPSNIKGMLAGNDNWRNPESHFREEPNKPTDMFSLGAVCIYAMLGRVIFGPDDDFRKHESLGVLSFLIRLQLQVSCFGDQEGVDGLVKLLGDEEFHCVVLRSLWEERNGDDIPYKPFRVWPEIKDNEFKDIIGRMMNLDPKKRVTAREALRHPWFKNIQTN